MQSLLAHLVFELPLLIVAVAGILYSQQNRMRLPVVSRWATFGLAVYIGIAVFALFVQARMIGILSNLFGDILIALTIVGFLKNSLQAAAIGLLLYADFTQRTSVDPGYDAANPYAVKPPGM